MKWLVLVFVLTPAATAAEVEFYKWILPDGSIEYSDKPPVEGAEKVELKPLVTYSPPATSTPPAKTEAESAGAVDGYQSFAIASPADEAAIRDNAGNLTISFAVTPKLVDGHAINVFMDGQKVSRSSGAAATLRDVSRGSHRIHATIVDEKGAEIARTGTITVHLKRASALF